MIGKVDDLLGRFVQDKDKRAELKQQLEALMVKDRADARDLHKLRLQSDDTFVRRFVPYLTMCIVLTFCAIAAMLFYIDVPDTNETIIAMLLGAFSNAFTAAIAFYYGTVRKLNN